jgi:hypothetical protein
VKYVQIWFEFWNSYVIIIGIGVELVVYTDVVECVQGLKLVNMLVDFEVEQKPPLMH